MSKYRRLTKGLNDIGKLIPADADPYKFIKNTSEDWYLSIYKYDEKQKKVATEEIEKDGRKRLRGVSGIEDVTTNILAFDVDASDLTKAKKDAIAICERLDSMGIPFKKQNISFSGNKGFSIVVYHNKELNPKEHKAIAKEVAKGLDTFDTTIYNASRVFRIDHTRHQGSKLYKTPLKFEELNSMTIPQIKDLARDEYDRHSPEKTALPDKVYNLRIANTETKSKKSDESLEIDDQKKKIDFSKRPKYLSKLKYALQCGFIPPGKGNEGMMILCSTYRFVGMDKTDAYYTLKSVNEKRSEIYGIDKRTKDEIWNQVINVVYADNWKGGVYSPEENELLQDTSKEFDIIVGKDDAPKAITDINSKFKHYVKNIDKNVVKTGIEAIDNKLFLSTGANVALLGAPGSGKSSLTLEILKNTSKAGIKSVFASLDMSATRMHEKILYKLTGHDRDTLYNMYQNDEDESMVKQIDENFGNVYLYDTSQPTVKDLRNYIERCELESGEKVKLVIIDYFERIFTDVGDATAASKKVAGELQDMVNDLDICLITLVQPNKMSGDMSKPILSYTNIKGSSFLAQSFRIIMSIHREGYSPTTFDGDKYLTLNILKNDLGEPASLDFRWYGKRGEIRELDPSEKADLKELRKSQKEDDKGGGWI